MEMNIVRSQMTISISKEERDAMQPILNHSKLTPHAFVKACMRYILFPEQRDKMPVDGYISMKETPEGLVITDAKLDVGE